MKTNPFSLIENLERKSVSTNTHPDLFSNINIDKTIIDLTIPCQKMPLQPHHTALLQKPCPMFVPCTQAVIGEHTAKLSYQTEKYHRPFSEITLCTKTEKLLVLLRIGNFFTDSQRRYSTSFNPRNILFTPAFEVAFLLRLLPDIPQIKRTIQDEFEDYRTLVLSVVQDQYTFGQLIQYGADILDKDPFCLEILETRTPDDLNQLLTDAYARSYLDVRKNRVIFRMKTVRILTTFAATLIAGLFCTLGYFVYSNVIDTKTYGNKMFIYENYYTRDAEKVINYANKLSEADMDANLKKIFGDALITTKEPANLCRAFYLDDERQIEIIEMLIEAGEHDLIAVLSSDNPLAQLYIAYYARDYQKAIELAENNIYLKNTTQGQTILAHVYIALNQYTRAQAILDGLGDLDTLLDFYKQYREYVQQNEGNIEYRKQLLDGLEDIINLIEEKKRAKFR